MSHPVRTREGVRFIPSETALAKATLRELAAHDPREEVRGWDILAEQFLTAEQRAPLWDVRIRDWVLKNKFSPGAYEFIIARTAFFDEIVRKALLTDLPQLVFLGAGYDSRPYRFAHLLEDTSVFELDTQPTQSRKVGLLERGGIPIPDNVVFIPIDFNFDDLEEKLVQSGYVREKAGLFIWEGVTYYLSKEAVDRTLASVRSLFAKGSRIAFDFASLSPQSLGEEGVKKLREKMKPSHSAEPVRFGIPQGDLEEFLERRGFQLKELLVSEQMEARYLTLLDGSKIGRVPALFNLVVAQAG